MSLQHFKTLYKILKEDGIKSAFAFDEKITLERHPGFDKFFSAYEEAHQANAKIFKNMLTKESSLKNICYGFSFVATMPFLDLIGAVDRYDSRYNSTRDSK